MKIRAVCTDVDGTLLNTERDLSQRTIAVIKKISKDVPVILASSRMPSALTHLQKDLGIEGHPLICYNGGFVIRYLAGKKYPDVLDSATIPAEVCESIINMRKEIPIHMSLYCEDTWYAPKKDEWTDREERITKVSATIADPQWVIDTWRKNEGGAHKIMVMGAAEHIRSLTRELNRKHAKDIHVYLSRPTYIEIAPKVISKGSALELVLEKYFNLSISNAVAFGDNFNDIDLIRNAGLGIAVANARDEVKAIADQVTGNSVEDGVAIALEHIFGS
jgi:Cof subfamily protein (haloacid dehalogenase superfamily)